MGKIEWSRVTWYSQIIAIVMFLIIFGFGIWIGMQVESTRVLFKPAVTTAPIPTPSDIVANVMYNCNDNKQIRAIYKQNSVQLALSDGRAMTLPQAFSADGARYTNADQSFVFWSKGTGAFITEGSSTTYTNCNQIAAPVSP